MRKPKITVIGAGDVGAATARRLARRRLGEVVVVALPGGAPAAPDRDGTVRAGDYDAAAGSDVIVVAVGPARAPGLNRDEPLDAGARVVSEAVSRAVRKSRDSIIVMISAPVDVMCEAARRASGFPRERVIGVAEALDPALVRAFGTADPDASREIAAGPEPGPADEAPAASAVEIVDAIVNDRKRIRPCFVYLQGEFGVTGVFVGVPARLGAAGLEGVADLALTGDERAQLQRSAAAAAARSAGLPADLGQR
jgi:malate dehydrogenase